LFYIATVWGFKIAFGGQRSSGFGVIYDSVDSAKKSLSRHLLIREGIIQKKAGKCPNGFSLDDSCLMRHSVNTCSEVHMHTDFENA
jgi:hypothetical protein